MSTFFTKFKTTSKNDIKDQVNSMLKVLAANKYYFKNNDIEYDKKAFNKLVRVLKAIVS